MKRLKKSYILIFVILFIVLACIIYLVPGLTGVLRSTYVLEYGELSVTDEEDGYFVRNEKVYFSGKDGIANRYITESKLVRKGTKIMDVEGHLKQDDSRMGFRDIIKGSRKQSVKTDTFLTEDEGIVTYNADGYEGIFTPKTMTKMRYSQFSQLDNEDNTSLIRE
ncbi:MAG: hypothetical protein IIZ34_02615 [Eubacterium sp.]|nr:hypothetical protein [Eubacterium sp.]